LHDKHRHTAVPVVGADGVDGDIDPTADKHLTDN
jgi:hypothetical protein